MVGGYYFEEIKEIAKKYKVKLISLIFDDLHADIVLSNEPNSIAKKESMLKEIEEAVRVKSITYKTKTP